MTGRELEESLRAAAEYYKDNIPLGFLLLMAAEYIADHLMEENH